MLLLKNLSRAFREGGREHKVLDNVSARIDDGEAIAIIGRSGSGKSTLLNVVSGIDRADSGSVELEGREVSALAEPERTRFRRQHIGFIYQFFNLVPTLNAEENVRLVLELNGIRGAEARRRSAAMLAEVGLGDRLGSAIDTFSGGEQQRVAIARALVHEPKLLLADEPTGNLDEETARQVFPLVMSLVRKRGATLLLVTHDRGLAASADRVMEMRDGKLGAADVARGPRPTLGADAGGQEAASSAVDAGPAARGGEAGPSASGGAGAQEAVSSVRGGADGGNSMPSWELPQR